MLPEGDYLFSNVGFSRDEKSFLSFLSGDTLHRFCPLGKSISLQFDTSQRYCTGWYDLIKGEGFSCPQSAQVEAKYDQCSDCQKRTGFNPAFYNTTAISPQQEQRNSEPHILYLAHFGQGIIKVGISHAGRGNARLLEQGARSAIILDTFPSATLARHYEAKVAALPLIAETIQMRKKLDALKIPYDHTNANHELITMMTTIEQLLGITFDDKKFHTFDGHYFANNTLNLRESIDMTDQALVSGEIIGMLGAIGFYRQNDTLFHIPLKKFTGYKVRVAHTLTSITAPAQQTSLF